MSAPPSQAKRWKWLGVIAGTFLFGGLLVLFIDPAELHGLFASLSAMEWAFVLGLYTTVLALRILRFRVAFGKRESPGLYTLTYSAVLHQFFNHIIPARLGELSLPYLLKQRSGIALHRSVTLLLAIRFYDLLILVGFGLCTLLLLVRSRFAEEVNTPFWIAALAGLLCLLLLAWGAFLYRVDIRRPPSAASGEQPGKARLLHKVMGFAGEVQTEFREHWTLGRQCLVFSLSVLVWFSLLLFFHLFLLATGTTVDLWQTVVGSTFANLTQLLPINSLGSIGTLEAGWSTGFYLVGLPIPTGVATGLLMHTLVILYLTLLAGLFKAVDLFFPSKRP